MERPDFGYLAQCLQQVMGEVDYITWKQGTIVKNHQGVADMS